MIGINVKAPDPIIALYNNSLVKRAQIRVVQGWVTAWEVFVFYVRLSKAKQTISWYVHSVWMLHKIFVSITNLRV